MGLFGLIFLIGFSTLGCNSDFKTARKKVLRVQLLSEPASLDPSFAEDGASLRVLANVMDGLVGFDAGGKLQNFLAESYRLSPDQKTYEFVLRKEARWSDGRAVLPEDFVVAVRRALSPDTATKMASLLFPIRGAKDFHAGKSPPTSLGVRVKRNRLVVELEKPHPYFIQAFSFVSLAPLRKDILDANGGKWPDTAPSTGAYHILSRVLDQKIVLEANPYFWGAKPNVQSVELLIIHDESTGTNLFERGEVDILTRVGSVEYQRLKKKGVLKVDPFLATAYVAFNVRKKPFDDVKWRKAVAGAIQKNELILALGTGETPACGLVPEGIEGHIRFENCPAYFSEALAWVKNETKDRKFLIEAGFDGGARTSLILEKIQNDLLLRLGANLKLSSMDWKSYLKNLATDAPPLFRFAWMTPFQDPILFLNIFRGGENPNNYSHWSDPVYDRIVESIEQSSPGKRREDLIRRAQKIAVFDQAVVVPLYHYVQANAVSNRVLGFKVNAFGLLRFSDLDLR